LADLPFKWPPAWIDRVRRDKAGVRFAINVFIAATIVWYVLQHLADTNPIWAIASMVAASEPQVTDAMRMFRSRLINVAIGCVVGLFLLMIGEPGEWKLPVALAIAVFVSSYIIHIQTMWRQAPITAAIVIAEGLSYHSKLGGIEGGLHKVGEVIFGCLVGVLVSWSMSKVWPLPVAHGMAKTG
jgi:uncharacterized membrane protein YccC